MNGPLQNKKYESKWTINCGRAICRIIVRICHLSDFDFSDQFLRRAEATVQQIEGVVETGLSQTRSGMYKFLCVFTQLKRL